MKGVSFQPDRRSAPRYDLGAPVRFDGGAGFTRDLSASGVLFETEATVAAGQQLTLSISIDRADRGGPVSLAYRGQVCRVEPAEPQPGARSMLRVAVALEALGIEGAAR